MKKQLLKSLIFGACLYNFAQAMEENLSFWPYEQAQVELVKYKIKYNCDCLVKENTLENDSHLEQVKNKLRQIIEQLYQPLQNLFCKNTNLVALFPKEHPTFKTCVKIEVKTEPKLEIELFYTPHYMVKEMLTEEENKQLNKFENELDAVLAELAKKLKNQIFEHINIPEEGPAIILDLELFTKKAE